MARNVDQDHDIEQATIGGWAVRLIGLVLWGGISFYLGRAEQWGRLAVVLVGGGTLAVLVAAWRQVARVISRSIEDNA